ncbi:hypothetical protein HK104_000451 [Borealophlyctis nickersoniae]|nr:hypothetical protein HK104_000451 [Borealophlyctis nickersoniae]
MSSNARPRSGHVSPEYQPEYELAPTGTSLRQRPSQVAAPDREGDVPSSGAAGLGPVRKKKVKKERPWKQQHLPRWMPVMTPLCVIIPLIFIGVVFIPLGGWLYAENIQVSEVAFDYTNCASSASETLAPPTVSGSSISSWAFNPTTHVCTIRFIVPNTLPPRVFMYVRISNMYQNHRLYVKSESADQLKGTVFRKASDITGDCGWLQYANCDVAAQKTWTGGGSQADNNPDCMTAPGSRAAVIKNADVDAQYYPCGLVANSMFTDSITPLTCINSSTSTPCPSTPYTFSESGIAWEEDAGLYELTGWINDTTLANEIPRKLIPPPQWRKAWASQWGTGYTAGNLPDFKKWERFQVWMRKAGLPTFRKLWGRNDTAELGAGEWQVSITDGEL